MTLFLSVPEFLSQQPDAVELQQTPQQLWTIPLKDTIGGSYGYRQRVNLRRGLDLRIEDYTLQEDLVVEVGKGEPREPRLCLEMSFMLCGHNRDEGVQPHHNFLECNWGASDGGQFHWQAGQHVLKFDIHIYCEQFEHLINRQFQADFSKSPAHTARLLANSPNNSSHAVSNLSDFEMPLSWPNPVALLGRQSSRASRLAVRTGDPVPSAGSLGLTAR